MDKDKFHDYVTAHGHGPPTDAGYDLGERLLASGSDYAEASAAVVFQGFTIEPEDTES